MWISDLECSSLFKVVSNYITVVDIYFQDCLPSTPWYSADSRHHDHSKRINVASRINDMKAMEESKEYKPCNQDKQGRKGSTNKFCQITGRIVTTTVTATAADQWLQFGLFPSCCRECTVSEPGSHYEFCHLLIFTSLWRCGDRGHTEKVS